MAKLIFTKSLLKVGFEEKTLEYKVLQLHCGLPNPWPARYKYPIYECPNVGVLPFGPKLSFCFSNCWYIENRASSCSSFRANHVPSFVYSLLGHNKWEPQLLSLVSYFFALSLYSLTSSYKTHFKDLFSKSLTQTLFYPHPNTRDSVP